MISIIVIVGLIVVWSIVLLPDLLSRISRSRRGDSIRSFNTQLTSLGRSVPVGRGDNVIDLRSRTVIPMSSGSTGRLQNSAPDSDRHVSLNASERNGSSNARTATQSTSGARPVSRAVRKRRQDVLVALGAAALLTLLATVAFGGVFLYVHLLADALFAAYLVALQRIGASQSQFGVADSSRGAKAAPMGHLAPLGSSVARVDAFETRRIAN